MSGDIYTTICGNLTEDASLRFTASGAAVANVSIASTPRVFKDGEWRDGETTYIRGSIWRQPAENVAESLTKGMRVIAYGRLKQRNWDDKDTGAKRSVIELDIEEIGPSLKYSTAKVQRTERVGASTGGSGRGNSAPADDPWGSAPPSGGNADYGDPPF